MIAAASVLRTTATSPVLWAILGGFLIGALITLAAGHDPVSVYWEILQGAVAGPNLAESIARAVPLVGMALVAAIPLRGGMVNLGGDGQLLLGGLVAALVALYLPAPGLVRLAVAMVAAMAVSGAYAALAAWGEVRFGVPLLISTLLLSYPAKGVTSYLARFPLRDPSTGMPETFRIDEAARLPVLVPGTPITWGLVLLLLVIAAVVFTDRRGTAGYELRLRGLNSRFAAYGGVELGRQTVRVLFASGAVAGLVGAILVLGDQFRFTDGALLSPAYTWSGLMAALLAMGEPIGAICAGLFFAALQTGGFAMERATEVPRVLTLVLQAVIILLLAMRHGLRRQPSGGR
ncbi:ABC transporter permease [Inquilinus sp.]|jgi:simple sugar transport system permease protein|uniref:ABC transporter permease n=1 Tax=Inquilinus sp. TaxID=1932117 RepID=UPI003782E285